MIKNFCIIGAGWYGCHISVFLKKLGHNVTIHEKENNIFLGSSGFNQFRLHQGFHYPRSSETIKEIKKNYKRFISTYKKYIFFPKNNFYCIAKKKSLIDARTYETILKSHKLKFKKINKNNITNIEGAYLSNEGVIKNDEVIKFYKKRLKENIILNKKITNINTLKKNYDYVLDCTNNTLVNRFYKEFNYVLTISLVYKKKNNSVFPITVMDGKLPSLYPYADKKNYFTLTHANFTHIKKFKNMKVLKKYKAKITQRNINNIISKMEKSILLFYPQFYKDFSYNNFFFSYKVLPSETSDKRSTFISRHENIISCTSPKITNIFSYEDYIKKLLKG